MRMQEEERARFRIAAEWFYNRGSSEKLPAWWAWSYFLKVGIWARYDGTLGAIP